MRAVLRIASEAVEIWLVVMMMSGMVEYLVMNEVTISDSSKTNPTSGIPFRHNVFQRIFTAFSDLPGNC